MVSSIAVAAAVFYCLLLFEQSDGEKTFTLEIFIDRPKSVYR